MFSKKEDLLYYAIIDHNLEKVKKVIGRGFDVNSIINEFGETPLIAAVKGGNLDIINYFLDIGADMDILGKYGAALHYCVIFDRDNIASLLIEKGANIEVRNLKGKTPLEIISYPSAVISLILAGAKFPYKFQELTSDSYGINNLKSAVIERKIFDCKTLTSEENAFLDSSDFVEGYADQVKKMNDIKLNTQKPSDQTSSNQDSSNNQSPLVDFYLGMYTGSFVISPAIKYLDDKINFINQDKSLLSYYQDNFDYTHLAKTTFFSIVFSIQQNQYSLANKLLIAKLATDFAFNAAELSIEYLETNVPFLVNSFVSVATNSIVQQTEFYHDNPFLVGVLSSTAGDLLKLSYDTLSTCYNLVIGEESLVHSNHMEA